MMAKKQALPEFPYELLEHMAPIFDWGSGERFRLVRMDRLKNQKEIAHELGVSQSIVCNIEAGVRLPKRPITLAHFIRVFGIEDTRFILLGVDPERYYRRKASIQENFWLTKTKQQGNRTKGIHRIRPQREVEIARQQKLIEQQGAEIIDLRNKLVDVKSEGENE